MSFAAVCFRGTAMPYRILRVLFIVTVMFGVTAHTLDAASRSRRSSSSRALPRRRSGIE